MTVEIEIPIMCVCVCASAFETLHLQSTNRYRILGAAHEKRPQNGNDEHLPRVNKRQPYTYTHTHRARSRQNIRAEKIKINYNANPLIPI